MALTQMGQTFKVLSAEALTRPSSASSQSQEDTHNLRESKLDSTLRPLEELLGEYKKNLADFNTLNAGALSDVKSKAAELLDAQQQTQYETRRLNQLLGRSSATWRVGRDPTGQRDERVATSPRHRLRAAGLGDER